MKAQTVILLTMVALLLVSSVALTQPGEPSRYVVRGVASGAHYRLVVVTWQVRGEVSGAGYYLVVPLSPTGTGTPCCCIYLPCVLRNQ